MTLEIKNLSKKYTKDYIFSNFSQKFDNTGLYLVVGESGRGKTTLLRLIAGLDKSFEGEIAREGAVSVAFQEYRLFPTLSALENVYLENEDNKASAMALLLRLGLSEEAAVALPGELSGGMKQRVSLARAILKEADILLLDEPTKEIDKENTRRFIDIIKEEATKRLVIAVTHTEEDFSGVEYKKISL